MGSDGIEQAKNEDQASSSSSLEQGQLTSSQELKDVFHSTFPQQQEEIVFAFGYGSGVFVQSSQEQDDKLKEDDKAEEKAG